MSEIALNPERFYERLERLQTNWMSQKSGVWNGVDAICIAMGTSSDSISYSKPASVHVYLFGYEFPDSVIVIIRNNLYFMATKKKCDFITRDLVGKNSAMNIHVLVRTKDEGQNRENFSVLINAARKGGGSKIGSIFKGEYAGNFIKSWLEYVDQSNMEKIEIAVPLGLYFSIKDEQEIQFCKKASILTNKILKHGFIAEMESILDTDDKKKHEDIAGQVEEIIMDPTKINVEISQDLVDSCYTPIIQSGGKYDIKVSASSNEDQLTPDIIVCSLGARYKGYCSTISRTFMVDAPPKVEKTYATLLALYNVCIETMTVGKEYKDVLKAARTFLEAKDASLLAHLPKSLGFAIGLEFRDSTLVLNANNATKFAAGMVLNISVGFQNVPLLKDEKKDAADAIQKLQVFSLLLADVVVVTEDTVPEVLTKFGKEFSNVSYNISGGQDEDGEKDEDGDEGGNEGEDGVRRSGRAMETKMASMEANKSRESKQKDLMAKRLAEGKKRLLNGGDGSDNEDEEKELVGHDLKTYKSMAEFPTDAQPNRLKVDLTKEALLVPLGGQLVPFHISTIKNMTQPDPDMRINFYVPGVALGKEVAKNMQFLVMKYGDQTTFIKELTFRSGDGRNLGTVYQQFMELRRRVRTREQKNEQEKDLVAQHKLIKIKDQRVPKLHAVTMRPALSGRKCDGTVEAHQNGLRFTSSKAEVLDVMYGNIKHAIFQPCERTTMVLVHFHLKDHILVGKKKQKDIQFYTEVIESSINMDGVRRTSYDPDELDDEQRERELRRRLNMAFKEFCIKVEKLASHYDFPLLMDVPFKKSGFTGTWFREMVTFQPTTNCLVNLTEFPPFVLTLSDIEHVHFERVTYATKAFDMSFIFKNWDLAPKTITAIEMKYMEVIQDWLNLVEITYTKNTKSLNWNDIMKLVRNEGPAFYANAYEDGEKKSAGWLFLSNEDDSDEEEEQDNEDESYGDANSNSDDESSSSEEEDDDDEFSESESDGSDEDELEEEGMDWDEMERSAKAEDIAKRARGEDPDPREKSRPPAKKGRR